MSEEKILYALKIYVAGLSPDHQADIIRLKKAMQEKLQNYTLEVIDVLENPHLAEEDKILATPAIVKVLPDPIKKCFLDLSNLEKIMVGMDIIKEEE